jgi:Excalibur calcium-binding domain
MLPLMKAGPWDKPKDRPGSRVVDETFRQYWTAQNRRYRRQRLVRQLGLSALVAGGGCAAVWAVLSYGPALPLSFNSSSSAAQVSYGPFRSCADARAAGAAPLRRGQPGYAYHLDADGDGIACEWSWRGPVAKFFRA